MLQQVVAIEVKTEGHQWILFNHEHDCCGQPLDEDLVFALLWIVDVEAWDLVLVPDVIQVLKIKVILKHLLTSFMWMSLKIFIKVSISWYILKQRFITFSRWFRVGIIPCFSSLSNSSFTFSKKYIMFVWVIRTSKVWRVFSQCFSMIAYPSVMLNSS